MERPHYPERPALGRTALLQRDWLATGLIAVLTCAVFYPALDGKFVNFDDYSYASRNQFVLNGLSIDGIKWAFTTSKAANWHPLTWLSLQLDGTLWNRSNAPPQPWGFHFTSVLLHSANAALLFLVLRSLTGAFRRSVAVAVLFAVHPLRVESVAWIAERKDVLSGFFGLLALLAYARYVRQPSVKRYLPVALALACSLMSKPMLVTMPFLLLVLDWWPLQRLKAIRDWRPLIVEKLPLFALAIASSIVTYLVQQHEGAVMDLNYSPPMARLANAVISYSFYLGKTFWPTGLAALYPHPRTEVPVAVTLAASTLLAAITATGIFFRGRAPYFLTGWLWYLGTLLPMIGLVQVGVQARADRYTYFPQIGILLALCWGVAQVCAARARLAICLAGAAAILLIAMTSQQITYWHDSLSLWKRALAVAGESATTYANLGETQEEAGNLAEATRSYRESLRLAPESVQGRVNLGNILLRQKRYDEAIEQFREATRVAPESPEGYINLGNVYRTLGKPDEAAIQFESATHHGTASDRSKAFVNLGLLEEERKNFARSEQCFQEALKLEPDSAQAYTGLGVALIRQDKENAGRQALQKAIDCDPGFVNARSALGAALARRGDFEGAAQQFEAATRINPNLSREWYNLGIARGRQQRFREAAECFARALELEPDVPAYRSALTKTLERLGEIGDADFANQIGKRVLPIVQRPPRNRPAPTAP